MLKITDYLDTPSVRVFQTFAGESLENLTEYDVWDLVTVIAQALSDAHVSGFNVISTDGLVEMLNLEVSDSAQQCINALDKFPENQVNRLMGVVLTVAFPESFT